jgi:hypothetical protein
MMPKEFLEHPLLKQQRKITRHDGDPKYSDSIKKQPGLVYELSTVLQARTPDDLSPQKQAILAYANLKMQSNDFSSYLSAGKQAASDVYGKVWVTALLT